jgi:dienelactone hydrolase
MSKTLGLLALVAAAAAAGPVHAGAGFETLDRQSVDGVTQIQISYPGHHRAVTGYLLLPPGEDRRSAVIFNHSGEGVTEDLLWRGRELASRGYVVFAPEYRADTAAPRFRVMPGDVENVLAGDRALRNHPRVDDRSVGIIGSGHGALIALLAEAEAGPRHFRCVAQASGNQGARDRAPEIKSPVFIQHGARDRVAEMQEARFMGIELKNTGNSSVTIKEYTLGRFDLWFHREPGGFTAEEISQADWAWDDLNAFLDRFLGTGHGVNVR